MQLAFQSNSLQLTKQQQRYSIQKKYKTAISQFFISCMGGTVIGAAFFSNNNLLGSFFL